MDTTTQEPKVEPVVKPNRNRRQRGGLIILGMAVALVAYGLYVYQFKPMVTMRLHQHAHLAIDTPPVELTSFQIRAGGRDIIPRCVAFSRDTVYVSFVDEPLIQIYSKQLKLLGSISLDKPATILPVVIATTDSQLIVADTIKGLVAVFDHDGDYISSAAWYPGRKTRIKATQLSTDGKLLTVVDPHVKQVAVISLIQLQPYYDFLELIDLVPGENRSLHISPSCATVTPEGSIWVGDSAAGKAYIFSPVGDYVNELEQPMRAKIIDPIDFAVAFYGDGAMPEIRSDRPEWQPDQVRVHLLDKATGRVCVYDLTGRLTLVYPQDRALSRPSSIAINSSRREIFITESGTQSITVFGY